MADEMNIEAVLDKATAEAKAAKPRLSKSHDICTATIKKPPYAYAHIELMSAKQDMLTDELTIRQYFTAALKQHLGITGMAVAVDILKVTGRQCWVRVPRQDLGAFSAALTAWVGSGQVSGLRICAAGDWLGALVGRHDQTKIWGES